MPNTVEVQMISAIWCKRCQVMKPDVERLCTATEATFTYVDFDDLEEDDPIKKLVTALPTIRMRPSPTAEWTSYTPAEIDAWKTAITSAVAIGVHDTDF